MICLWWHQHSGQLATLSLGTTNRWVRIYITTPCVQCALVWLQWCSHPEEWWQIYLMRRIKEDQVVQWGSCVNNSLLLQTDVVIKAGALPVFPKLLKHHRNNIVKEAAWTISNITAGNVDQIQSVIDCGLIGPICEVLDKVWCGKFYIADNSIVTDLWNLDVINLQFSKIPAVHKGRHTSSTLPIFSTLKMYYSNQVRVLYLYTRLIS